MEQIRDYGDNRTLVLHLPAEHPRLSDLKARAAWAHPYNDTRQRGRVVGYDLAFTYTNGDRAGLARELQAVLEPNKTLCFGENGTEIHS